MARAKQKGPEMKNISFKVSEDLHTAYRLVCVASRKDMKSEFIKFMEAQVNAAKRKREKAA